MKSIVFDNAGTIIKRVTALKDLTTQNIIYETNTIGIVNQNDDNLILVFQTPTKELIKNDCKIIDYLKSKPDNFEISYSRKKFTKNDVFNALKDDTTSMLTIKQSAKALINKYSIDICSGSALIINIKEKKVLYSYTAGGIFYEDTKSLFNKLNSLSISIYVASGDNKDSLLKIASILEIPHKNVFDTCNSECKESVVKKLQETNDLVIMVGNNTNDYLAIKKADIGVLSLEQGESLPEYLIDSADYVINNIGDVLKIVEEEV